ncbi:TPA: ESPR-type extended signal peptide-containing protein, partial [Acinetobacter baumannii]
MNKIYKVVFNKSTGRFVVASENAKAAIKSTNCGNEPTITKSNQIETTAKKAASFKLGMLVSSILFASSSVFADLVIDGSPAYPNTTTNSSDFIVVGEANHVTSSKTVSIFGINNNAQNAQNVLLSGNRNYVISSDSANPSVNMTMVGNEQTATNSSHVSSLGSNNSFYGDYIGIVGEVNKVGGTPGGTTKASNVYGLGFNNKIGTLTKSSNIQFIGSNSNLDGNNIYGIGDNLTSQGNNNVLIGGQVKTIGSSNTAVGNSASVEGRSSTAIGANSAALSNQSTAVGYIARANADSSVAVGNQATVAAGNTGSVALGSNSNASGTSLKQDAYLTNSKATAEMNIANGTSQRRITGVADGALDTDAVTVRQLKAAESLSVKYDDLEKGKITLGGAEGTVLGNV